MKYTFKYKGLVGRAGFISKEDQSLTGRIVGIRDLVTFHGENMRKAELDFQDSVDEYLKFCEEVGKNPHGYVRRRY